MAQLVVVRAAARDALPTAQACAVHEALRADAAARRDEVAALLEADAAETAPAAMSSEVARGSWRQPDGRRSRRTPLWRADSMARRTSRATISGRISGRIARAGPRRGGRAACSTRPSFTLTAASLSGSPSTDAAAEQVCDPGVGVGRGVLEMRNSSEGRPHRRDPRPRLDDPLTWSRRWHRRDQGRTRGANNDVHVNKRGPPPWERPALGLPAPAPVGSPAPAPARRRRLPSHVRCSSARPDARATPTMPWSGAEHRDGAGGSFDGGRALGRRHFVGACARYGDGDRE